MAESSSATSTSTSTSTATPTSASDLPPIPSTPTSDIDASSSGSQQSPKSTGQTERQDEPQLSADARALFARHATTDVQSGSQFLDQTGFVAALSSARPKAGIQKIGPAQFAILFSVADQSGEGKVSLRDWAAFENLVSRPDGEYEIAFRLFDRTGSGRVAFEELVQLYRAGKTADALPFDWNGDWAALYLGSKSRRHDLEYGQFAQMLRGLQGERIRQAFQHLDKDSDGYIEPDEFARIIRETGQHKVSDFILDNLATVANVSTTSKISYATVRAFANVLREASLVGQVIAGAASSSKDGTISRTEFLNQAGRMTRSSLFTPLETDILFHFAGLDRPGSRLTEADFEKVLDENWEPLASPDVSTGPIGKKVSRTVESAYSFGLGSIAGAFGAFMVYPIDLVKTRLQNQRSARVGQVLYKNSIDCARKVIKNEGFRGLYSGVVPQLVGVAPEKAIKLSVNDLMRGRLADKSTGDLPIWAEMVAGGTAGACQVIFTNPLEIVKIRLQVQGEVSKTVPDAPRRSAMWIVRNLGLLGLYRGASACLLRDVPFSAIYFPTYNHLKKDLFNETATSKLQLWQLLASGAIAGMPAAYLTTPCDVIKTRLQVEARKGEASYATVRQCAKAILTQEGPRAFFKGGPARIVRSSPQFGFTLAGYEVLQNWFPLPGSIRAQQLALVEKENQRRKARVENPMLVRSRNAVKMMLDLDENFGRLKADDVAVIGVPGMSGGRFEKRT